MIEFNGYLTNSAQKHFLKRARALTRNILSISLLLLLPAIVAFSFYSNLWIILKIYCVIPILFFILLYIPKSKKEKTSIMPKRIFTEDEYIICITDKCEEVKKICDVKKVKDFGEFYEIVFPLGKVSEKFICQKELLSKGSLEEFESMFEGKIEKYI